MVAHAGGQGSLIGATIGGYEVVALIGRGAMGAVYLARDVKLKRMVALKVLLGSLAKSPSLVKQFHQEAQASAPLNHPSIVRVYSAGIENGTPFIAMEYVEGEPLDRFLKRKGKVKWDVALHIGYKLAQGLESAHKAGVVHRDIKPSNIMLDKHSGMRLADFGIAKIQSGDAAAGAGGSFLGTPQYMSPEQAKNEEVGPSSDLYSLGVTLYQMISGELPFTGESSMALINSICNDEPTRLNKIVQDVPDDVARFVAYLLGKTPKERPANARVAYSMMQRLQKQRGESTSISDGLSGFVKSEMEIRAFQSLAQMTAASKDKKSKKGARRKRADWGRIRPLALRATLICVTGIAAFWIPDLTLSQASVDIEVRLPASDALDYQKLSGGIEAYQMASDAYTFSEVRWIGDEPMVWLEVQGIEGMATHGDIGVMGVDVREHRSVTIALPSGPMSRPDADPVYQASLRRASVISLDSSHLLANRFLLSGIEKRTGEVVVLSRPWDRAYADPMVLLRTGRENWIWGEKSDQLNPGIGAGIVNPNGKTICYLMVDPELGHTYLLEQSLEEEWWLEWGMPRTSPGNEIIAGSVQFTSDGAYIFYLRQRSVGGSELWRMSSSGKEQDGQAIITGVRGSAYSLNLNGDTVLLTLAARSSIDDHDQVALVQVHTNNVKRIGAGRISKYAWHPSSRYFVVNQAPPVEGEGFSSIETAASMSTLQLVAIHAVDTDRRVVITDIQNGIKASYAVSPDGQYVSAIAQGASTPSMLILNWSALGLD